VSEFSWNDGDLSLKIKKNYTNDNYRELGINENYKKLVYELCKN
jgi:hypothetical protein